MVVVDIPRRTFLSAGVRASIILTSSSFACLDPLARDAPSLPLSGQCVCSADTTQDDGRSCELLQRTGEAPQGRLDLDEEGKSEEPEPSGYKQHVGVVSEEAFEPQHNSTGGSICRSKSAGKSTTRRDISDCNCYQESQDKRARADADGGFCHFSCCFFRRGG